MSALTWFIRLKLSYKLEVGIFFFTIIVYGVFFLLGKKWRGEFEAQGVSYWRGSKQERMAELMVEVWEPKKIIILYTLSYFSNGFVRTTRARITAGAFYDMAADSFAIDVTPPEYHARVLGSLATTGQSVGAIIATILPIWLLNVGGYKTVFALAGVSGLSSFLFLWAKEPKIIKERAFSREAVAFTFTQKTVLMAILVMFSWSFTPQKIISPLGGMFSFTLRELVGGNVSFIGSIGLAATLSGLPGSLLGGRLSDEYGHKRTFILATLAYAASGLLWMTLSPGGVTWFIVVAIISSFFERFWIGTVFALMADATPLAMSSTVYQMYMSWSWIGNIPASLLIGYLLGYSIRITALVMSALTIVVLIFGIFIRPYEAGKASSV
jgi:MFS family permease